MCASNVHGDNGVHLWRCFCLFHPEATGVGYITNGESTSEITDLINHNISTIKKVPCMNNWMLKCTCPYICLANYVFGIKSVQNADQSHELITTSHRSVSMRFDQV